MPSARQSIAVCLAAMLAGVALVSAALAQSAGGAGLQQPPNLGDLKAQLLVYKNSGAYERDLAGVDGRAKAYVESHAAAVSKPALVLDIDETSLSNWPEIIANDFGYIPGGCCARLPKGPCGARAWDLMAKAKAIGPTLDLFNAARAKGVSVFFITGRDDSERAATLRNLRAAGYRGWTALVMRPRGTTTASAADFKAPQRAKIAAAGYTIIANVGDQPSDLAGGNPDDPARQFLLPDPFYRVP